MLQEVKQDLMKYFNNLRLINLTHTLQGILSDVSVFSKKMLMCLDFIMCSPEVKALLLAGLSWKQEKWEMEEDVFGYCSWVCHYL